MPANPDLLAEAFAAIPEPRTLCPLGALLEQLETAGRPEVRKQIEAALAADRKAVPNLWIIGKLKQAQVPISKDTLGQHRSGVCRCAS